MRASSRAFGVFLYAASASALATFSFPLASAMQISLALPLREPQASLSLLYCASAFRIAASYASLDIGAGFAAAIGASRCVAQPPRASTATPNNAIISFDIFIPPKQRGARNVLGRHSNDNRS